VVILGGGSVVRAGRLSELRRDTERLIVVVDDKVGELAALLREGGFDVAEHGEGVSVVWAEGVHDAVRDAVADLDVGLRRLAPERQSLEDVYMEASA
jgi:ABC-2 type transport system ATP-binding protein